MLLAAMTAMALTGDVSGGYSWGGYSSPGQPPDTHAGMGVQAFAGARYKRRFELGATAAFSFPQIQVRNALNDAAFTAVTAGLQAGYLWRERVLGFVQYLPLARLTQTTPSPVSLSYLGSAFGGGAKFYLTEWRYRQAQVGLKFTYLRELYDSVRVSTRAAADRKAQVSGNAYQVAVFIGL
jgi:hypothetical protein